MSEAKVRIALWQPGWYELDQAIEVALRAEFEFLAEAEPLVFYNALRGRGRVVTAVGTIVSITHPKLGAVRKVDTKGLDYTFFLEDGLELVVNAEEDPGKLHEPIDGDWQPAAFQPDDWTLTVQLAELAPLRPTER